MKLKEKMLLRKSLKRYYPNQKEIQEMIFQELVNDSIFKPRVINVHGANWIYYPS